MDAIGVLRALARKEDMKAFIKEGRKSAGIFVSIAAWASYQRTENETQFWRNHLT